MLGWQQQEKVYKVNFPVLGSCATQSSVSSSVSSPNFIPMLSKCWCGGELTFCSDTYPLCAPVEVLASFSTSMMPRMDRCLFLNQKKLYSSCQRLRIMVQNIKRIFSKEIFFIFFNLGHYILREVIWRSTKIITNNASVSQLFEFLQSYSGRVFCFGGLYLLHFSNLKLSSNNNKKKFNNILLPLYFSGP